MQEQAATIEIRNISKSYEKKFFKPVEKSLEQVSMLFEPGQCTGIMGHNGAGKTTTIRTILGLVQADKGKVLFNGRSMTRLDREFIGYMPERDKIAPNLSPLECLQFQLSLYSTNRFKDRISRINQVLAEVGLEAVKHKRAKTFSKGMKRRLAWALSMIHSPQIYILDEPFSGMDPLGRIKILEWIKSQTEGGKTVILCSHELELIVDHCHNFYVLKHGKTIATKNDFFAKGIAKNTTYELEAETTKSQIDELTEKMSLPKIIRSMETSRGIQLTLASHYDGQKWINAMVKANRAIFSFRPYSLAGSDYFKMLFEGSHSL